MALPKTKEELIQLIRNVAREVVQAAVGCSSHLSSNVGSPSACKRTRRGGRQRAAARRKAEQSEQRQAADEEAHCPKTEEELIQLIRHVAREETGVATGADTEEEVCAAAGCGDEGMAEAAIADKQAMQAGIADARQLTRDALLEAETGSVVLALFHKHEAIDNSSVLLGRAQEMLTAAGPQPPTVMKTAMAYDRVRKAHCAYISCCTLCVYIVLHIVRILFIYCVVFLCVCVYRE